MICAATFRLDGRLVISHTIGLADAGRALELAGDKPGDEGADCNRSMK